MATSKKCIYRSVMATMAVLGSILVVLMGLTYFENPAVHSNDGRILGCWGSDRHGYGALLLIAFTGITLMMLGALIPALGRWRTRILVGLYVLGLLGFVTIAMRVRHAAADRCELQRDGRTP